MKFLIALSLMASFSALADTTANHYIKCYDVRQGDHELTYKFKVNGDSIKLVYPHKINLAHSVSDGDMSWTCLASTEPGVNFEACRTQGQYINGFIPVELTNQAVNTAYCETSILEWIEGFPAR